MFLQKAIIEMMVHLRLNAVLELGHHGGERVSGRGRKGPSRSSGVRKADGQGRVL